MQNKQNKNRKVTNTPDLKPDKYTLLGRENETLHHMFGHFSHFHYLFAKIAIAYELDPAGQFTDVFFQSDIHHLDLLNEYFHKCEQLHEMSPTEIEDILES